MQLLTKFSPSSDYMYISLFVLQLYLWIYISITVVPLSVFHE